MIYHWDVLLCGVIILSCVISQKWSWNIIDGGWHNTTDGRCGWMWIAIGIVFAQVAKINSVNLLYKNKLDLSPRQKYCPHILIYENIFVIYYKTFIECMFQGYIDFDDFGLKLKYSYIKWFCIST